MASKLTPLSRFLITILILAIIFFAGKYVLENTELGKGLVEQSQQEVDQPVNTSPSSSNSNAGSSGGSTTIDELVVQIFTWGGYAPGLYFNEGAESSDRSRFTSEYGIKVRFELIDDFDASRQAWIADQVHLLGNETSAMNTEMERLGPYDPRVLLQCDWSRGGDAVVVRRGVNSVNDLKGKKVAFAGFTPSVSFLIYMLEAAGLTMDDIEPVEVPLPTDAATAFKGGQVDAAVVWSPDDLACIRAVPGSKVLQSTRDASHIIADIYMIKDKFVNPNKELLAKFYEGWMKGAAEINANESNKEKAAKILAEVTGIPVSDATGAIDNVRLTTHGDNLNFFGQNTNFKGVTGQQLYEKMGTEFEQLGQAPQERPSWRAMAYPAAAVAASLNGAAHRAEGEKEFAPVTEKVKALPAISSKLASISFATGQFALDDNAKTIIDLQFSDIAKTYANTRIRIEGNTDNVGGRSMNKELSLKRAKSVAEYLQSAYGISKNRFIIIGNGPDKPVKGCEKNATAECKAKNRRTEFQLVAG
ncbi:MAG: phosphate ABC transporter substrate-binding/OmpA family protein [Bacteroidota bacterium]